MTNAFVNFSNKDSRPHPKPTYDGYLSFIPSSNTELLAHRSLHNNDFYWLEVKDSIPDSAEQITISTEQHCLWLYIDFSGRSVLYASSPHALSTGEILCYHPSPAPFDVHLNSGRNWLFMIGIAPSNFERLAAEYPLVQDWLETLQQNKESKVMAKMLVHSKLFRVLDSLQKIDFNPFSTYYLLMAWNLRLFSIIFNEAKDPESIEKDHAVELYHKTVTYLRDNIYEENLSLQTIAKAMNVSSSTLTRCFANRPYTVIEYLLELRLNEAKNRIISSKSTISSIIFYLNFPSLKRFSRLFKKRFGKSPTEYREMMKQKRALVK